MFEFTVNGIMEYTCVHFFGVGFIEAASIATRLILLFLRVETQKPLTWQTQKASQSFDS